VDRGSSVESGAPLEVRGTCDEGGPVPMAWATDRPDCGPLRAPGSANYPAVGRRPQSRRNSWIGAAPLRTVLPSRSAAPATRAVPSLWP